ncbi:2-(1,2-epoxy-1,2-dihydrophenyl)acetyl-CoA isomerase PaaG [Candidatus Colwellia aromaticivorans]|jgi:2-(1,2-epoxy-1,2-dihydrophenyl)acetyl-CoA isomerase|uniref:2-(1,2-epoxy-1,2-dihydrophenyl)acetyl-CoA isomerase PaaG n=1 Tax=Candidatus Colwellia aromaticivorans TaxID=2267621 RepID=UPI000DF2A630|nr:2-(1,2-epoxy-1,2-dihydrophenyl)acetyl-CoA isomerase PaaG [Candidatus Colwellia aromaticivorans]
MSFSTITYQLDQGVAVLTLNRPASLNSFNALMHDEVREAMKDARDNSEVRCLVITAAGRGFCAGQDLSDRSVKVSDEAPDLGESVEKNYNPLIRNIMTMEKPVLCAVNGVAAGAGASIALACDIVLAAKSAKFIQAFCKIGLVPDSGGTFNLVRALGLPRAKALALLGDKLSAEQAQNWGMIWQCVEDESLMDETMTLALHLATQPTKGLAKIKELMNNSFSTPMHQQLELEKYAMRELGRTSDYREGVSAFMEKRQPTFTGE